MPKIYLSPLSEQPNPDERTILRGDNMSDDGVFFRGARKGVRLHCGECRRVLARNISVADIEAQIGSTTGLPIVIVCPSCDSANELLADS